LKTKVAFRCCATARSIKRPADPSELTKAYTDEAIGFIRQNKDQPFFLYLPHTMAHVPMGISQDFQGKSRFGLYGDVIQCLDFHVGRILDELERLDIANNTLIVYASDNGRGPGRNPEQPIRGHKLSTWEGGIRVPCIAWGPGLGVRSNQVSAEVIRAMDWYPTFATFAGVKVPEPHVIDGRDISPLLTGKTKTVPPPGPDLSLNSDVPLRRGWNPPREWADIITRDEYHQAFFYHGSHGALAAVRWDKWKLQLHPAPVLYDLEVDPRRDNPGPQRQTDPKAPRHGHFISGRDAHQRASRRRAIEITVTYSAFCLFAARESADSARQSGCGTRISTSSSGSHR
jgi:arylsulfatase A